MKQNKIELFPLLAANLNFNNVTKHNRFFFHYFPLILILITEQARQSTIGLFPLIRVRCQLPCIKYDSCVIECIQEEWWAVHVEVGGWQLCTKEAGKRPVRPVRCSVPLYQPSPRLRDTTTMSSTFSSSSYSELGGYGTMHRNLRESEPSVAAGGNTSHTNPLFYLFINTWTKNFVLMKIMGRKEYE